MFFKFTGLQQKLVDKGANPFIQYFGSISKCVHYVDYGLSNLTNLPKRKSVFFTTQPLLEDFKDQSDFASPWFYNTGVFGEIESKIDQGAHGIVLKGTWFGRKAAFKYVDIGTQIWHSEIKEPNEELEKKLYEMKSLMTTEGSKIVKFYGHYM